MMNSLRAVIAVVLIAASASKPVRGQSASSNRSSAAPLDGKGNNLQQPLWGAAATPLIRYPVSATGYPTPNGSIMAGSTRSSARAISVKLMASPYIKQRDQSRATNLVAIIGQYATTDITKVPLLDLANGASSAPIPIPANDSYMSNFTKNGTVSLLGTRTSISFQRSKFEIDKNGVRQQINSVTHFLDASNVYGSSSAVTKRLRAGSGGLLKDDGNRGLPYNEDVDTPGIVINNSTNEAHVSPTTRLRAAGFSTVNQHPGLLALSTVWLREHNRRAAEAVRQNPSSSDENAFQYARKWVMAHHAHVVYDEYLPALLGTILPVYGGYNGSVNPSIDNFFSAVAYRYGHSTVTDVVFRLDEHWQEHKDGHLPLAGVWFQPDKALSAGIEPILRGAVASPRGQVEPRFSAAVQQHLFGPSNINGSDLFAINIQRGRDHGIPDYNTCRRMFGLPPVTSFRNITPDESLAAALEELYAGELNNIDAYVGGLAEPHYGNAHVGQLFYLSIFDQFKRLRDGDWWYYKNADNGLFTQQEIAEIDSTTLRDIILRNTNITELPDNIWTLSEDSLLGVCPAGTTGAGGSGRTSSSSGGVTGAALAAASGSGAGSNMSSTAGPFQLLGGAIELTLSKTDDPGKIRVRQVGKFGQGFMGFGVAKPGQPVGQKMVRADMAISHMVNGKPDVDDYHTIAHVPPLRDSDAGGKNNIILISYERTGDQTVVVFERPLAATDSNGMDVAVSLDGPNSFIVAHGQDDSINYHGIDNRAVLELPGPLFGGDVSSAAESTAVDATALKYRQQHGTLMAVNFILVFPLGALMARQLRARWLSRLAVKAILFYLHIATQMCGVALATAGFILAKSQFNVPYQQVPYSHGFLGVAVLSLVYIQLFLGFIRPPAASAYARSFWQLFHALFGRAALILGITNVFIGIYLLNTMYKGNIALWGGLCAAGLGAIALLQAVGDLLERRASEALAAQLDNMPKSPTDKPPKGGPTTSHKNVSSSISRAESNTLSDDNTYASTLDQDQMKPYNGAGLAGRDAIFNRSHAHEAFGSNRFIGISPVGGSGLGRSLYWGPDPSHEQIYPTYDTDEEHGAAQHGSCNSSPEQQHHFVPGAVFQPVARSINNTIGHVGSMLKRSTSREPPQLHLNPQVTAGYDPNSAVFCDYETPGVYDPTSGAFQAASHSKKAPVQEVKLPAGLDQSYKLPAAGAAGLPPPSRRQSSGSDTSSLTPSAAQNRSRPSAAGSPSWRTAAAAAAAATSLQQSSAANRAKTNVVEDAVGRIRPAVTEAGSSAAAGPVVGSDISSKLAAAKAALAVEGATSTATRSKGSSVNPSTSTGTHATADYAEGLPRLSSEVLRVHNSATAAAGANKQQQQQQRRDDSSGIVEEEEQDGLGELKSMAVQYSSPPRHRPINARMV